MLNCLGTGRSGLLCMHVMYQGVQLVARLTTDMFSLVSCYITVGSLLAQHNDLVHKATNRSERLKRYQHNSSGALKWRTAALL